MACGGGQRRGRHALGLAINEELSITTLLGWQRALVRWRGLGQLEPERQWTQAGLLGFPFCACCTRSCLGLHEGRLFEVPSRRERCPVVLSIATLCRTSCVRTSGTLGSETWLRNQTLGAGALVGNGSGGNAKDSHVSTHQKVTRVPFRILEKRCPATGMTAIIVGARNMLRRMFRCDERRCSSASGISIDFVDPLINIRCAMQCVLCLRCLSYFLV